MIINITGSPPASAILKNTVQSDNSKRFTNFDERVSDEISKFSDDDKLHNISDLNNPAYTLAPSNKPFEPIKNTERSEAKVVNDKNDHQVKTWENQKISQEKTPDAPISEGDNTTNVKDTKKESTSESASVSINSEKAKTSTKNDQMANINNQDAAPKLIISQKTEQSTPHSIDNPITDFKNSSLSKLMAPDNSLSVQSLTKEGQDKGSEAKTLQEAFKQLNAEMQNSPNPMETKEISRFTPVEKVGIEPERTVHENLVKVTDHHDQPVKKTSAKDGNDNFAENPDLKQDGNKSKESKADGLQSAVNYGNISKAYQKGNSAGIISPLPSQKVDVAEFAQRTLQMVKSVPSNGITSAKLILSPPALGSLQIDISLKADHVRMSIKAENQDTLKMIENQIGALRDKLAEHGLKTEKIELTYRNENHEKHLDAGQEKQRRNEEDKKLRRDFLRTFSGNQLSGEELESQLTYIPASGSYLSQRNLTGV